MTEPALLQIPLPSADPQLIASVLRAVADQLAAQQPVVRADEKPIAWPYQGDKGVEAIRVLASRITPKARWVLRQVAADNLAHGEALGRTLRKRAGDVHEGALGGWVRSLSAWEKKLGLPSPFATDWEQRADGWQVVYRMDRELAEAVMGLLDEGGRVVPGPSR